MGVISIVNGDYKPTNITMGAPPCIPQHQVVLKGIRFQEYPCIYWCQPHGVEVPFFLWGRNGGCRKLPAISLPQWLSMEIGWCLLQEYSLIGHCSCRMDFLSDGIFSVIHIYIWMYKCMCVYIYTYVCICWYYIRVFVFALCVRKWWMCIPPIHPNLYRKYRLWSMPRFLKGGKVLFPVRCAVQQCSW